jgi:hypothetical protein
MTDSADRPTRRAAAPHGRVSMAFDPGAPAPGGAYVLRGGLAWPRFLAGGGVQGYALLLGRHEATGEVFVFEEQPFVTVDWLQRGAVMDPAFAPVAPFFALCWHHYLARIFWWRPLHQQQGEYVREVLRCPSISPKPVLPLVDWDSDAQALVRVFVLERREKLAYRPGGGVDRALAQWGADKERKGELPPALEALASALLGLSKVEVVG